MLRGYSHQINFLSFDLVAHQQRAWKVTAASLEGFILAYIIKVFGLRALRSGFVTYV
jgi:hypothetical protein